MSLLHPATVKRTVETWGVVLSLQVRAEFTRPLWHNCSKDSIYSFYARLAKSSIQKWKKAGGDQECKNKMILSKYIPVLFGFSIS